jgi:hypothetical protein
MAGADTCASCGDTISIREGSTDRVLILSGVLYCSKCLKDVVAFECHRCRKALRMEDFEKGRAMVLLGHKYCDHCLEEAVEKRRNDAAASPHREPSPALLDESGKRWQSYRAHPRFLPPQECSLAVHRQSVFGLLAGNGLRLWVDVSEGGLRVILRGNYEVNGRLKGTLSCSPRKLTMEFRATVRYVKKTDRFPGSTVVGLRFDEPSHDLKSFLREIMEDPTSVTPTPGRKQLPNSRAG